MTSITKQLDPTITALTQHLLPQRSLDASHWTGHLSSSALSTATALYALATVDPNQHSHHIDQGLNWLAHNQNNDGGWGDTTDSPSNLSTTLLCYSALTVTNSHTQTVKQCEDYLRDNVGSLEPQAIARAVDESYGRDKTFSVPILTMCALSGRLGQNGWNDVRPLPFELAALPRQLFAALRLPVVSYALPALIAIGQIRHHHQPPPCPIKRWYRNKSKNKTLALLETLQPSNGGFLEAAPLTSFVTMSLAGCGLKNHPVVKKGIQFLTNTIRPDGSWPIDTNLATWVTTLAINALASGGRLDHHLPPHDQTTVLNWLLNTQHTKPHPYTNAAPGGWAWSNLPGAVPDADDTAGALLALHNLAPNDKRTLEAAKAGIQWLLNLQNKDSGIPTFCKGWTNMPFDRSCPDITAHVIAALTQWQPKLTGPLKQKTETVQQKAQTYLANTQNPNGSWHPLWFGNQHSPDQHNPTYGTARVLTHLAQTQGLEPQKQKALQYLIDTQHPNGPWGGAPNTPPTLEETALALDALASHPITHHTYPAIKKATHWLIQQINSPTVRQSDSHTVKPSPIGLYFAKLWYSETMYPQVFALAALEKVKKQIDYTSSKFS